MYLNLYPVHKHYHGNYVAVKKGGEMAHITASTIQEGGNKDYETISLEAVNHSFLNISPGGTFSFLRCVQYHQTLPYFLP